jgi:magnesium chelatase family protein
MIAKYQHRISGPILDRIDIHLEVSKLASLNGGKSFSLIRERVKAARSI